MENSKETFIRESTEPLLDKKPIAAIKVQMTVFESILGLLCMSLGLFFVTSGLIITKILFQRNPDFTALEAMASRTIFQVITNWGIMWYLN